jgi:hypothetical protein
MSKNETKNTIMESLGVIEGPYKSEEVEIEVEKSPKFIQEALNAAPDPIIEPCDLPKAEVSIFSSSTSHKLIIGDNVEVVGLDECRLYAMVGKVTKLLPDFKYAVEGMCYLRNKKAIGHDGILARTFKEINLRKIELKVK